MIIVTCFLWLFEDLSVTIEPLKDFSIFMIKWRHGKETGQNQQKSFNLDGNFGCFDNCFVCVASVRFLSAGMRIKGDGLFAERESNIIYTN